LQEILNHDSRIEPILDDGNVKEPAITVVPQLSSGVPHKRIREDSNNPNDDILTPQAEQTSFLESGQLGTPTTASSCEEKRQRLDDGANTSLVVDENKSSGSKSRTSSQEIPFI
jgi:hypothetical protein